MPTKKQDDAMSATHFTCNHHTAAGPKGTVVTAEELRKTFGKDRDATPEEHDAYQKSSLKRLLDLGAITPAEAPPDPAEEAEKAEAERQKAERVAAEEEAAARKAKAEAERHPSHQKR